MGQQVDFCSKHNSIEKCKNKLSLQRNIPFLDKGVDVDGHICKLAVEIPADLSFDGVVATSRTSNSVTSVQF